MSKQTTPKKLLSLKAVTSNTQAHNETHLIVGFSKAHDVFRSNANKVENQSLRFPYDKQKPGVMQGVKEGIALFGFRPWV